MRGPITVNGRASVVCMNASSMSATSFHTGRPAWGLLEMLPKSSSHVPSKMYKELHWCPIRTGSMYWTPGGLAFCVTIGDRLHRWSGRSRRLAIQQAALTRVKPQRAVFAHLQAKCTQASLCLGWGRPQTRRFIACVCARSTFCNNLEVFNCCNNTSPVFWYAFVVLPPATATSCSAPMTPPKLSLFVMQAMINTYLGFVHLKPVTS